MSFVDYYKILGIRRDASSFEIEHAITGHYNSAADSGDYQKLNEVNAAIDILCNTTKKAEYDIVYDEHQQQHHHVPIEQDYESYSEPYPHRLSSVVRHSAVTGHQNAAASDVRKPIFRAAPNGGQKEKQKEDGHSDTDYKYLPRADIKEFRDRKTVPLAPARPAYSSSNHPNAGPSNTESVFEEPYDEENLPSSYRPDVHYYGSDDDSDTDATEVAEKFRNLNH